MKKMTSPGYRRKRNKKESKTVQRGDNLFNLWPSSHSNCEKVSALEASKWSQITFCILTNILNSISERFGLNFEQIDISLTASAITEACIVQYNTIHLQYKTKKPSQNMSEKYVLCTNVNFVLSGRFDDSLCTGEQEIPSVCGKLPDNLGE